MVPKYLMSKKSASSYYSCTGVHEICTTPYAREAMSWLHDEFQVPSWNDTLTVFHFLQMAALAYPKCTGLFNATQ